MPLKRISTIMKHNVNYQKDDFHNFRVKPVKNVVPTYDTTQKIAVTNTGSVQAVIDPKNKRGFVLLFSGSNYLSITIPTPATFTKTFWLYSNSNMTGNIFSSTNCKVSLNSASKLQCIVGSTTVTTNLVQGLAWNFYAIVMTATSINIYINNNETPNVSSAITTFNGDTNVIQFGAVNGSGFYTGYIDDMRLYDVPLTTKQITSVYKSR